MPQTAQPPTPRRFLSKFIDFLFFLVLVAVPALLFLAPLRHGAIPYFMDTVMYFAPLRVHAARLWAGGDWPLWNRCLMGGVPLFENPQAALAYPFHWPFLFRPTGFWFTFPMLAQLGLWAGLSFWVLRRLGAGRGAALFSGALALAGSYGWSRLQYGNFLNVLPWWALWLGTAEVYAATGGPLWIIAGAAAVALSVLGGAHQLAAYGLAGLAIYGLAQICSWHGRLVRDSDHGRAARATDIRRRRRWTIWLLITFSFGLAIAAPGWLPQAGFIRETQRAQSLNANEVLQGTLSTWKDLARALTGDWQRLRPRPENPLPNGTEPWADAESQAAIGLAALGLAALVPRRRALRRAWLGCWIAALTGILLSLRVVMEPLLKVAPLAGAFHDPRRWLGLTQWMLILAAGIGAASLRDFSLAAHARARRIGTLLVRLLPAVLLLAAAGASQGPDAPRATILNLSLGLALFATLLASRRLVARVLFALLLIVSIGLLGHATWVTTDLKTIPLAELLSPKPEPLIARAGLNTGQRFFSMDWSRGISYDYTRGDLAAWALPNLACFWGVEDLGGYDPAQSERYRAFIKELHETEPWRWSPGLAQHFGLVGIASATAAFDAANVRWAILPRWGVPLFFGPTRQKGVLATGYPQSFSQNFQVRVLCLDGALSETLALQVPNGDAAWSYPLTPLRPLGPQDDLAATTRTFAGPHSEPPAQGRILAAAGDLPPQFGPPPALLLGAPNHGELLGVFAWGRDLDRLWKAQLMDRIAAVLMRYRGKPSWTAWSAGAGQVLTSAIGSNRLDIQADVTTPTLAGTARLVIHDAFWPGWQATIDGRDTAVQPEGLWRAIDVPAGRHTITMLYQPPAVMQSIRIATAAGIVLLALCLLAWITRKVFFRRSPGIHIPGRH